MKTAVSGLDDDASSRPQDECVIPMSPAGREVVMPDSIARGLEGRVERALRKLLDPESPGGFVIVEHGHYYVQFAWEEEQEDVQVEVVSDQHLPQSLHLAAETKDTLRALGFCDPQGGEYTNFFQYREVEDATVQHLVGLTARVFAEVFRVPGSASFKVTTSIDENESE